jgi:hypothetical protein
MQTTSGTEYKYSKCHKVVGNVDTVVADSACTLAGLSAPYVPSKSCSTGCPTCDMSGCGMNTSESQCNNAGGSCYWNYGSYSCVSY